MRYEGRQDSFLFNSWHKLIKRNKLSLAVRILKKCMNIKCSVGVKLSHYFYLFCTLICAISILKSKKIDLRKKHKISKCMNECYYIPLSYSSCIKCPSLHVITKSSLINCHSMVEKVCLLLYFKFALSNFSTFNAQKSELEY